MDYRDILLAAKLLASSDQARLISDLLGDTEDDFLSVRRNQLLNKRGSCLPCGRSKYIRFGKDKGSQRFRCKQCRSTFTEYSGSWVDNLHKKSLVVDYIQLMIERQVF